MWKLILLLKDLWCEPSVANNRKAICICKSCAALQPVFAIFCLSIVNVNLILNIDLILNIETLEAMSFDNTPENFLYRKDLGPNPILTSASLLLVAHKMAVVNCMTCCVGQDWGTKGEASEGVCWVSGELPGAIGCKFSIEHGRGILARAAWRGRRVVQAQEGARTVKESASGFYHSCHAWKALHRSKLCASDWASSDPNILTAALGLDTEQGTNVFLNWRDLQLPLWSHRCSGCRFGTAIPQLH